MGAFFGEMIDRTHIARSESEMIEYGKEIGGQLKRGSVVALSGDLGAGKTHFSKGIVLGLGNTDQVTSPTFALVQEYRGGRLPVFHFDFYRLESVRELIQLGWDDYLDEEGVVIVEWAEKFPEVFPEGTISFQLSIEADGGHKVTRV